MRLAIPSATAIVAAWLLASGAGAAAPTGHLQYIGTVTGDPERDSYGYVGQVIPQQIVCIVGPKRYFGEVIGNPEKDTYSFPVVLVSGTTCPAKAGEEPLPTSH